MSLEDFSTQGKNLLPTLKLIWEATRRWMILSMGFSLLRGLWPVLIIFLVRDLVDSLVHFLKGSPSPAGVHGPISLLLLLAFLMLVGEILQQVSQWIRAHQAEYLRMHIEKLIQTQAVRVDLSFYEKADYYDHLHRARHEAGYRPAVLLENLASLLENSVTFLAMGVVLVRFGLWLPGLLLLSTLPALYVVARYSWKQHQWRRRTTQDERRTWYYDWLLTSGETAAEIRLLGLGNHFRRLFETLRLSLVRQKLSLLREQAWTEILASTFALTVLGGTLIWMLTRVMQQQTTLGNLTLFYQAFSQGQQLLRALLANVGHIYANSLFLGNLFEYLSLDPILQDPPSPLPGPFALKDEIRFEGVSFRYGNSSRPVFENLNLAIPAGKLTAIVGPNGAGKSTLVKLLCRLYDPDQGEILWDGSPLCRFATVPLRRQLALLLQDPVRFNSTVLDNIGLGDLERPMTDQWISTATRFADADEIIRRLPRQYNTLLGNWFEGGTELSQGEWQRLALARSCYRDASLLLLDEPTSFMDPWAESEWLAGFQNFLRGRTAILITHRMTTACRADLIYVMEQGQILETGTHEALLHQDGLYWRSWESQRGAIAQIRPASPDQP